MCLPGSYVCDRQEWISLINYIFPPLVFCCIVKYCRLFKSPKAQSGTNMPWENGNICYITHGESAHHNIDIFRSTFNFEKNFSFSSSNRSPWKLRSLHVIVLVLPDGLQDWSVKVMLLIEIHGSTFTCKNL